MVVTTVDRIVQQAAVLDPEAYLVWCDTIEKLGDTRDNPFGVPVTRYGDHTVITMDDFYWPDDPARATPGGQVLAFKEPGAYIETYYIFAVNRTAQVAWALHCGMGAGGPDPLFDAETAAAVCAAFNGVWHARKRARVAEENKVVDRYLDQARTLSPEAYLDWCDARTEDERMELRFGGGYNDHHIADVDPVRNTITGARFKTRFKDTCDLVAVFREAKEIIGVRYFDKAHLSQNTVPDTPLLTGATADAVVKAAMDIAVEEKKSDSDGI